MCLCSADMEMVHGYKVRTCTQSTNVRSVGAFSSTETIKYEAMYHTLLTFDPNPGLWREWCLAGGAVSLCTCLS